MKDVTLRRREFPIITLIALVVAFVASIVLAAVHSPLTPLPGTVAILLIPGAVLMSFMNAWPSSPASRIVLAVCLSLMAVMVVGGVASLLGPHVGLAHPLGLVVQRIVWSVLAVIVVVICAVLRRDPVRWTFDSVGVPQVAGLLIGGLLVVFSILGVARLNHSGDNNIAVASVVVDVVVLLLGIVGGWSRGSKWPLGTMLYVATLSLLLSTSLRGGHLYGWDIQEEFGVAARTVSRGLWVIPPNHDPYASMLSLTVLPAILRSFVRLRLTAFFEIVVPAVLALLPLAMFSAASHVPRWVQRNRPSPRPGLAFGVVVAFVISSQVFPDELVTITRQAMALTMLSALVMVMMDGSIPKRNSQIAISSLLIAISFTHYSTSFLVAGVVVAMWLVGLIWSMGWLIVPSARLVEHRSKEKSRKIVNSLLVAIALVAAFGWNLGITRNNALTAPSGAIFTSGIGLSASTGTTDISAQQLEKILILELHSSAKWIVPLPDASAVHLESTSAPSSPGFAPRLEIWWNRLSVLLHESIWALALIALFYGIFRLERRQRKGYTSDLLGLGVAGLLVGATLRFFGTLATFYSPERGAVVAAILLVVPIVLFFDDIANRISKVSLGVGVIVTSALAVWATGIGTLLFGGQAPGAIVARGENVERFVVSTPELATAVWLRDKLNSNAFVQTDRYGQLVLLSEPGRYGIVPEIVPPEVDERAYIYLSTANVIQRRSRVSADNGRYLAVYKSNLEFFDRNFYIVFSTGLTRVYHG